MPDAVQEVDEHDKLTGRVLPRAVVCDGTSMVVHRCVAVYVFDTQGRVYIQTHKKSGLFDHSVGGHVDAGENYAIAARRETEEELGIAGVPFHELGTGILSNEPTRRHMFGVYECYPIKDWRFVPNDEVDEIIPMAMDDLVKMVQSAPERFTSGFINVLKFYLKQKKLPYEVFVNG
ncbi:MAG TPA: NUDIX domain-containing protein [Candidatus Saccharimonadales bacterium]|nr:NUDIX domain-containing protein [Candidatus Saccharimonadales bacterium]